SPDQGSTQPCSTTIWSRPGNGGRATRRVEGTGNMTKKKKLPEQRPAYDYWAVTEKDATPPANMHNNDSGTPDRTQQDRLEQRWHEEGGRRLRESVGTPVSLRRVVTVPRRDPYHAGHAFVERQRRRRERAQSSDKDDGQTQYVARTLAQTG